MISRPSHFASAAAMTLFMAACGGAADPGPVPPPATTESPETPELREWEALPPSPLSSRESAYAFWTGKELLVMGGSDAAPCPPNADCLAPDLPNLRDGAAFDPGDAVWRSLALAPVPLGAGEGVVSDGVVYLWLHGWPQRPQAETAFLSYDPASDSWTRLPMPAEAPEFPSLGVAGAHLVLYQPTQENGVDGDLLFDPVALEWVPLPEDPLTPSYDRAMVWTGSQLLTLGIELDVIRGGGPNVYAAAAYDPVDGWQRLPDSEVVGWNPTWYAAGGKIINPSLGSSDGGQTNNWGRHYPFGGVLDSAAGAWLPLPDPPASPGGFTGTSAAGDGVLLSSDGWVLDTSRGTWTPLPPPPDGPRDAAAVAWVGSDLLVWGGVGWQSSEGPLLSTGWSWRPVS